MQKILINEKEYLISFNFGTIKNTCKELGSLPVPQLIKRLSESDLEVVGEILYQGIKYNHEDFDRKEIDGLSMLEMFQAFETVGELLSESMPQVDKKKVATKNKK